MENNFSTNYFEGEYTNSTIYSNETLNNSSSKKSPKYSLANEKYCNYLLKKLSTPFPKIENKTKLTKHCRDIKTVSNFDFLTTNSNKIKQTKNANKTISNTKTSPHKIKKTNKFSKSVKTLKMKNAITLDKLYGFDKKFYKSKNYLKKKIIEDECLKNYQEDILKISGRTLSRDNLMKLYSELREIRDVAEMSKPLPPMNFRALVMHSICEKKSNFKKGERESENKNYDDMDDFEKEMYNIKKRKRIKKNKNLLSKGMYKIYEILPEHVVDVLYKQKRF